MFRRNSHDNNKKKDDIIAEEKDKSYHLELQLFDLRQQVSILKTENIHLKEVNRSDGNEISKLKHLISELKGEINQLKEVIEKKNEENHMRYNQENRSQRFSGKLTTLVVDVNQPQLSLERQLTDRVVHDNDNNKHEQQRKQHLPRKKSIIFTDEMEFERFRLEQSDIKMKYVVGTGSFGWVWRGELFGHTEVAVKVFKSEDIDIRGEVLTMSKAVGLDHVMDLIGVVEQPGDAFNPPQVALVMPFMSNGSLQDVCYKNSPTYMASLSNEVKIKFCHQAAKGILHLHEADIIHRDLACRNLLVDAKMDVFVADFGFARLKRMAESKGYTKTDFGPVRWEAPESLERKEYSEKTDAFSFGVCLYEITVGVLPWAHLTSAKVAAYVSDKKMRMVIPINCDPVLADIMSACWNHEPEDRPDFISIIRTLGERHQQVLAEEKDIERRLGTIEFMIRGEDVLKLPHQIHKKKITKKPQQRYLRLTSDLQNVFWRSSTANSVFSTATRNKATERGISISEITDVQVGQTTETFRLQQMELPVATSFSLITATRSVDIVCESSYHRDLWVAGMRLLLTRQKASQLDVDLSQKLAWSAENEIIDVGSFNLLRKIAYRLQLGDMLLKYTSRKVHARHVFLSRDLTQLIWSVKEEEGPVKKGRNKSLLMSEIERVVVGVQPPRYQSNAGKHVSATAFRLSEKLNFRASTSEQAIGLNKKSLSNIRSKKGNDDLAPARRSSLISRIFKDKDEIEKKKDKKSSVDSQTSNESFASLKYRRDNRDRASDISSLDDIPEHDHNRTSSADLDDDEVDVLIPREQQIDNDRKLSFSPQPHHRDNNSDNNSGFQFNLIAQKLSEKLNFGSKTNEIQSKKAAPLSKVEKVDDDESIPRRRGSMLSRIFKDKDEKEKKKDKKSSTDSQTSNESFMSSKHRRDNRDRVSDMSSLDEIPEHQRKRSHSVDLVEDDDDLESMLSGAENDDHQLTVSFLASDGRTLLSFKCPNREIMVLWKDGIDLLLRGIKVMQRHSHQVHSYTHPSDFFSVGSFPRHGVEESDFSNIKTPIFADSIKPRNFFKEEDVDPFKSDDVLKENMSDKSTPLAGEVVSPSRFSLKANGDNAMRREMANDHSDIPVKIDLSLAHSLPLEKPSMKLSSSISPLSVDSNLDHNRNSQRNDVKISGDVIVEGEVNNLSQSGNNEKESNYERHVPRETLSQRNSGIVNMESVSTVEKREMDRLRAMSGNNHPSPSSLGTGDTTVELPSNNETYIFGDTMMKSKHDDRNRESMTIKEEISPYNSASRLGVRQGSGGSTRSEMPTTDPGLIKSSSSRSGILDSSSDEEVSQTPSDVEDSEYMTDTKHDELEELNTPRPSQESENDYHSFPTDSETVVW